MPLRPNRPVRQTEAERAAIIAQLQANVAFENAVVGVLAGAGVGGGLGLGLMFFQSLMSGFSVIRSFSSAIFLGVTLAIAIFFIGFLVAVIIIAPLNRFLEKSKRRSPFPYLGVSIAVTATALIAVSALPVFSTPGLATNVSVVFAGFTAWAVFARKMKPVWLAAKRQEETPPLSDIVQFPLH